MTLFSCEKICDSKAFVDIATAGRHCGLSTIYIKHNLFHQSKLGRDVDVQNPHIVFFKSPRDVMEVITLSAQLGLGSELVYWYRDATSVPSGHLLIDLSPRTEDRLRCCTITGSLPSKFYIPDRLKQSKILIDQHTRSLYSSMLQSFSRKYISLFLPSSPKEFIQFLHECITNLLKGNLQSMKRHHVAKLEGQVRLLSLKRTTWKQRRDILASEIGLQLIKVYTPRIINNLF